MIKSDSFALFAPLLPDGREAGCHPTTFNLKAPESDKSLGSFWPSSSGISIFVRKSPKMSKVCKLLVVSCLREIEMKEHCSRLIRAMLLSDKSIAFIR